MKRTLLILAVAILACVPFVTAQTTGSITLNGTVPTAVSITNNGGTTLSTTITLASLAPANDQGLVKDETVSAYLRSNKGYKLNAQTTALSHTGTPDNGLNLELSDIGFGIRTLVKNGADVVNTASHVVVTTFDYTGGWPTPVGGLTPFDGTANKGNLGQVFAAPTQILSGNRISKLGNITTATNAVQVTMGFAVLPQYFTPEGFSTIVTLTIVANP